MEYVALAIVALVVLAVAVWWLWPRQVPVPPEEARAAFESQRAELERLFFIAASSTGKPRGLRWTGSELGPGLELARDKRTGELLAFVPVTVSFEAIPGSDMEGLPAVGNLRSATAVFMLRGRRWTTVGRTVFNLDPAGAIQHFQGQYEPIVAESHS